MFDSRGDWVACWVFGSGLAASGIGYWDSILVREVRTMPKVLFSVGGSSGLGWDDYVQVGKACDELGFYGFYPSDHLGPIGRGGPTDRLDAMTVLAALSQQTRRLRLGALVMGN